jgi:hypothetical protein
VASRHGILVTTLALCPHTVKSAEHVKSPAFLSHMAINIDLAKVTTSDNIEEKEFQSFLPQFVSSSKAS